jgi:hypothetical protein
MLQPVRLSFADHPGLSPYRDFWAIQEYICTIAFTIDIVIKMRFLAVHDHETKRPIVRPSRITYLYLRGRHVWLPAPCHAMR